MSTSTCCRTPTDRRLVGSPVGVAVDLYQLWKTTDLKVDLEAVSAVLASCHEVSPDPHLSTNYTVAAALDARGIVTSVEHRDSAGSEASRARVAVKIRSLRFPPGATLAFLDSRTMCASAPMRRCGMSPSPVPQ